MYVRKIIRSSILTGLLLVFSIATAQNFSGIVFSVNEAEQEEPLIGANVYWEGGTTGTVTDSDGKFNLTRADGDKRLVVAYPEWPEQTFEVPAGKETMEFRLAAPGLEIDVVEITDQTMSSVFDRMNPMPIEIMNQGELQKAACCNLGEAFETNPSVDVAFSDAVTGARQIRMLGLAGQYVNITADYMPLLHGLGSVYGLDLVPGPWIQSIQIAKGAGSVINGFEAMAGQINVQYRAPLDKELLFLNGYVNQAGRFEGNGTVNLDLGPRVSTNVQLHGASMQNLNDRNEDGFLDMPTKEVFGFMNRWQYQSLRGLEGQANISILDHRSEGGQINFFLPDSPPANYFGYFNDARRYQAHAKVGYVSPKDASQSIGTQWSYTDYSQVAQFGNRAYDGRQRSFYMNIIGQAALGSDVHTIKMGFSYQRDNYEESLRQGRGLGTERSFDRIESVPGVFGEYTYMPNENVTLVTGLRADAHNLFGNFFTPRLNLRYAPESRTVIRIAGGRGQRSPNLLTDNLGLLASNRIFQTEGRPDIPAYGFRPEVAWNYGISVTQDFLIDYRLGQVRAEFFRTDFTSQVVVDRESPQLLRFYALNGPSFANSFLLEVKYELIQRLDLRLAYRYYDVRQRFDRGLLVQPFNPAHRGFANMAYRTRRHRLEFDLTAQVMGPQRIPGDSLATTPTFALLNGQVTKGFGRKWEVYLGTENLLNYQQEDPIVSAEDPFAREFDATLIWAPVFGRNIYAGFRFTLLKDDKG